MNQTDQLPTAPSDDARSLVLASDTRNNVARELLKGIVTAAQTIEKGLAEQAGRWVALAEVMAAEKAARPRNFEVWAKGLVVDFDDAQKQTFVRDLNRIKTLHSAAQKMLPERVGQLHELIFHRPEEFAATGGEIVLEIGEALQRESDADSKHGLFKWASDNLKPEPRTRKPRTLSDAEKVKAEQRRAAALFDGLCESLVALATPASVKALATLPPRELKALRQRWEQLSGDFARKLKAIKD